MKWCLTLLKGEVELKQHEESFSHSPNQKNSEILGTCYVHTRFQYSLEDKGWPCLSAFINTLPCWLNPCIVVWMRSLILQRREVRHCSSPSKKAGAIVGNEWTLYRGKISGAIFPDKAQTYMVLVVELYSLKDHVRSLDSPYLRVLIWDRSLRR